MTAETHMPGLSSVWPSGHPLIGMVHLLPLPGSPRWGGSMHRVLDRAEADANALAKAGFDGVIVENFGDVPFFPDVVPPETIAALTSAVSRVASCSSAPVGVNVLRNDARAALGIAVATEARFIRVNVHTGSMWTDQGLIEGRAHETMRARRELGMDVAVLADVFVKHATPPTDATLEDAANDTFHRGLADALIVSGRGTGLETELKDVQTVRATAPDVPLLIGSGMNVENGPGLLALADGAIVGSAVMNEGRPGSGIDPVRAAAFISAVRG